MIGLNYDTKEIAKLQKALAAAGSKIDLIQVRALNHTGPIARTAMIKALVPQTGLKRKPLDKALKEKLSFNGAPYEINAKGGNVRLMFFKPRETRAGVIAKPWNKPTLYPGQFMKGGSFKRAKTNAKTGKRTGGRVPFKKIPKGVVIQRAGKSRYPLKAANRSGLFIPEEMTKGNSEAAFYNVVSTKMPGRIEKELMWVISGK